VGPASAAPPMMAEQIASPFAGGASGRPAAPPDAAAQGRARGGGSGAGRGAAGAGPVPLVPGGRGPLAGPLPALPPGRVLVDLPWQRSNGDAAEPLAETQVATGNRLPAVAAPAAREMAAVPAVTARQLAGPRAALARGRGVPDRGAQQLHAPGQKGPPGRLGGSQGGLRCMSARSAAPPHATMC